MKHNNIPVNNKNQMFSRRKFIKACGSGTVLGLAASSISTTATPLKNDEYNSTQHRTTTKLNEYGFWDYTTPGAGGMEAFEYDDYMLLLDDMKQAKMNSLMIMIKWLSTGYRSRLPFLDQSPGNKIIESDNNLLRKVIDEARKRNIKVWIGAAVTYHDTAKFGSRPHLVLKYPTLPFEVGLYDTDVPELPERIINIYEEILELFPDVDGLEVELEETGRASSHRIPLYNQWAKSNNRSPYEEIRKNLDARYFEVKDWRDYSTYSRLKILKLIEDTVRGKGFQGDLAMICETGVREYMICQEVNTQEFKSRFPKWSAITYLPAYEKTMHRYAMMDFCIEHPKNQGLKVYYLPRGVMTWNNFNSRIKLEQSWAMEVEDVQQFIPYGMWWFGCGTKNDGGHISLSILQKMGYHDGVEARRDLLKKTAVLSAL